MKHIRFAVIGGFVDAMGVDNQFAHFHPSILLAIKDYFSFKSFICYQLKFRIVKTANLS